MNKIDYLITIAPVKEGDILGSKRAKSLNWMCWKQKK